MNNSRTGALAVGALLVAFGVLFLLQNFGLFGGAEDLVFLVLFGAGGLAFLYVFATNQQQWWAVIPGFVLLGLAFGQSSGVVNSKLPPVHRYTGAAIVANSAWFIGAGFAPLVALFLASRFGVWSVGLYLLSGVLCTLVALAINREWAARENT